MAAMAMAWRLLTLLVIWGSPAVGTETSGPPVEERLRGWTFEHWNVLVCLGMS